MVIVLRSVVAVVYLILFDNQARAFVPIHQKVNELPRTKASLELLETPTSSKAPQTDSPALLQGKDAAVSEASLHIGGINWNLPCTDVRDYILKVTSELEVENIEIKHITTKARDVGKEHGGSATVTLISKHSANVAMERFQANLNGDSKIGNIKVRWAFLPPSTRKSKSKDDELSEDRILHRKKRAEKYARRRRAIAKNTEDALESLSGFLPEEIITLDAPQLNWSADHIPNEIDPMHGGGIRKGTERGMRKQAQVEAFWYVLQESILNSYAKDEERSSEFVADLGSGAGNLSLPLAWFLKEIDQTSGILAVDINERALDRLSQRAREINVDIQTLAEDLLQLSQPPDETRDDILDSCSAILSLHACGAASDLAIQSAVSRSIPFAVSPCCIGKIKTVRKPNQMPSISSQRSGAPEHISYPRSQALKAMAKDIDYNLILAAADYSAGDTAAMKRGRVAKRIVEADRLKWAEERGYYTRMMELPRLDARYPKREILLGAKRGSLHASRISQLSSSTVLYARMDGDDYEDIDIAPEGTDGNEDIDRMDLGGFAGYLAPYALALIASLGVTAAFLKFVLLDY